MKKTNTNRAHEYTRKLNEIRSALSSESLLFRPELLEHSLECSEDWNLFHSCQDVLDWFHKEREQCSMRVSEIPILECRQWHLDPQTGNITHASGDFFQVHGLRVHSSPTREVGAQGWDQPILTQVGYDGGLLGILKKRFSGVPHYLLEAKAEPGNYGILQLSPTLQATFSNLRRAHQGNKPRFSDWFDVENPKGQILYKAWLSEDGGRLYKKRNFGMLVEVDAATELAIPESFIWVSMYQIKRLLHENAIINPHVRGIIAHL